MNVLVKKVIPIATLVLVVGVILALSHASDQYSSGEPNNSLSVSGSERKLSEYESINTAPEKNTSPLGELEEMTLSEFLNTHTSLVKSEQEATTPGSDFSYDAITIALKLYGNRAGQVVFDNLDQMRDESTVLEAFINEPEDAQTRNAMKVLADEYIAVGDALNTLTPPETVAQLHKNFADAYRSVGDGMHTLLTSSVSVDDLLSYNKSVEPFIDAYVNLAQTFRVYGVTFSEDEPGSLFTLPF